MGRQKGSPDSGVKYVTYHGASDGWNVSVPMNGLYVYIGLFSREMLGMAIDCRNEAVEATSKEELKKIRERYARLKQMVLDGNGDYKPLAFSPEDESEASVNVPDAPALGNESQHDGKNGGGTMQQDDSATHPAWAEASNEAQIRTLAELLYKAREADRDAITTRRLAEDAHRQAELASERARNAWNAYAEALAEMVGESPAFQHSKLGALLNGGQHE